MAAWVYCIDPGALNLKIRGVGNDTKYYREKNIAALSGNKVCAYGNEAYRMYEKTPGSIEMVFPVSEGKVCNFDVQQEILFSVMEQRAGVKMRRAEFAVAVPSTITDLEKRVFYELFYRSKSRPKNVYLCEKPLADARGLGLDIQEKEGQLIIDFGASYTDAAIVANGRVACSVRIPIGGNHLDEAIVRFLHQQYHIVIGLTTACRLKETIGSLDPLIADSMTVVGRDMASGLPVTMEISAEQVRNAILPVLNAWCDAVRQMIGNCSPELLQGILNRGIYLTGGGASLKGLKEVLAAMTFLKIRVDDHPEDTTVNGLVRMLEDWKKEPVR